MSIADLNFGDLYEAVAHAVPDRPAIIYGDQVQTWREFDQRSNRLARFLRDAGLSTGSKVAFYLKNSPAYLELFSACAKGRFTHANVNYRYVDHELFHVLDNSDAEAVVFDTEFSDHIVALRPQLHKVKLFLEVGGSQCQFASRFSSACENGDESPLANQRSGKDLYFMYTGGTTGYPKAVMWQHQDRIAVIGMTDASTAAEHAEKVKLSANAPVTLPACPLMHSTGFTSALSTHVAGGCVVLLPTDAFDPAVCLQEIVRNNVSRLAIVGDAFSVPILKYLREHPSEYDLSGVKLISSAGAMWSEHCKRELLDYFPEATLSDSLGSSEGSRLGASVMSRGEAVKTASFKLGPLVKIFTEDFREVEPGSGEAGMIAKAGPLPLGYYKDPERTAKTFPTVDGVRYSMAGDWCQIETDGSMILLGRGNNCINTGGEKVYPEEVEEVLKTLPEIHDVAVLGVADERWGQAVTALVTLTDGFDLDQQKVIEHLSASLARYKHPKHYYIVAENFRHENGKINYRAARKLVESAAGSTA